MSAERYWFIKVLGLIAALAAVLWTISSLKDGRALTQPDSPLGVLVGAEPTAASGATNPASVSAP